jgi:hypothetical protein
MELLFAGRTAFFSEQMALLSPAGIYPPAVPRTRDSADIPNIISALHRRGISTGVYGFQLNTDETKDLNAKTRASADNKSDPVKRAETFISEFTRLAEKDSLPRFTLIHLPIDWADKTPAEALGELDRAVGMIVEAVSHSPVWGSSVIFIVDCPAAEDYSTSVYRTEALVISPFSKRGFVDSRMYTPVHILRTIELVFSIPPLSIIDAQAEPVSTAFRNIANITPFNAVYKQ